MKTSYYGLLKMIDESSAPKEVKYKDMFFEWNNGNYRYWENTSQLRFLSDYFSMENMLKDEIEILDNGDEEKGLPKKLGECAYVDGEIAYSWSKSEAVLKTKINELIDYLEKQRKGE